MEIISQLLKFGVPGVMLVVFLYATRYLITQHREERKELIAQNNALMEIITAQAETFQELIKDNTTAFTELKNAIQNLK